MGWELVYDDTWYFADENGQAIRRFTSNSSLFTQDITNPNFTPGSYFLFFKGLYGASGSSFDVSTIDNKCDGGRWYFLCNLSTTSTKFLEVRDYDNDGNNYNYYTIFNNNTENQRLSISSYSLDSNTISLKLYYNGNKTTIYYGYNIHYQLYKVFSNDNWVFN